MWKVFKVNKKDTSKTRVNCCSTLVRFEQTFHLVWVLLWLFFKKQINVRCGTGSILMSITSHIHNAANHVIAKTCCQSYFKQFEVFFSRKQQGVIRTYWKLPLRSVNNFSSGYLTFDIFNNVTFFGAIQKTVILYLPMLIET